MDETTITSERHAAHRERKAKLRRSATIRGNAIEEVENDLLPYAKSKYATGQLDRILTRLRALPIDESTEAAVAGLMKKARGHQS